MSERKTKEDFIKDANAVHKNKYDYSKVNYINSKTKVCIICPVHGEFWQKPEKHLKGQGCPYCGGHMRKTDEKFKEQANAIHNGFYDYSKVVYNGNHEKVCIICPVHGEFWQTPHNHLKGKGCPECAKGKSRPKKYDTETFIKECKKVHEGESLNYSETVYNGMKNKVKIICPEHGPFYQLPHLHLYGATCPKCSHKEIGLKRRLTFETFVERGGETHNNKYDYSKVKYVTAKRKVCIICPKHGEFWQTPEKHLIGCGCPKCAQLESKGENEIFDFIKNLVGEKNVIHHDREILDGKELDIFIPSLKFAIEYNGLFWHTRDKNYHVEKTKKCKEKDVRLLHIFEDEYINNKEIVFDKLRHILGKCENYPKIMGRKCETREITKETAKQFLSKNHVQGYVSSTIYLGAFYNGNLIAVMSFKKEDTQSHWELTRFASDNKIIAQGVGGKLFNYFVRKYKPQQIKSFADRRWTTNEKNNLYIKLGFKFVKYTAPDYRYYKPQDGTRRYHKFRFRKQILSKRYNLPLTMTESEMTSKLGYRKIYDCGLIKYIWKA